METITEAPRSPQRYRSGPTLTATVVNGVLCSLTSGYSSNALVHITQSARSTLSPPDVFCHM